LLIPAYGSYKDSKSIRPKLKVNFIFFDYVTENATSLLPKVLYGSFPKQWVDKAGFGKVRLYISGSNLFTLSTLSKYYIDPEVPSGTADRYYPQQRTISFGLNLDF